MGCYTDAGGVIEDVIDGKNGNIIAMNNQELFKVTIKNILNDPAFFNNYSNMFKDEIRNFEEQAIELETYYKQILKKRDV